MKKLLLLAVFFAFAFSAFCFDWPQKETESDSFYSYFGQLRGGTIGSSLIFKDNSDIKAADKGKVVALIKEHDNDFGWFESTLGNTVILEHQNQMFTVYANLDEDSVPEDIEEKQEVAKGCYLGQSGNSGWQEGQSCLEFKVFDTKNKTTINPRVLMPRIGKELPLIMGGITLEDKKNVTHYLQWERYLPSGNYLIYRDRQETAVPYKTVVSVNGAAVETISYDTLKESDERLCITGNTAYSKELIYPDSKRELLANIMLTHGRNTLTVTIIDILGSARSITYNLDIY